MNAEEKQISLIYKVVLYGLLTLVFIVSIVSSVWSLNPQSEHISTERIQSLERPTMVIGRSDRSSSNF